MESKSNGVLVVFLRFMLNSLIFCKSKRDPSDQLIKLNKLNRNETTITRKNSKNLISSASSSDDYHTFEKQFGRKYGTADSIPYGLKSQPHTSPNWNVK